MPAYYPASVEYGFKMAGGKKHPGQYAMAYAMHKNEASSLKTVVDSLQDSIDELLR